MLATSISGAEVPKPTIVRPMMSGDTPKLRAVAEAPSTNRSALHISRPKPVRIAIESINIGTDKIHNIKERNDTR